MDTAPVKPAGYDEIEHRVLAIVEELVAELGGAAFRGPVTPESVLDRDLSIGSLERVELLVRLEEAFGVLLPDAVMAEAESPRDLAEAIRVAAPTKPEVIHEIRLPISPGVAAPSDARTLVEVLRWHAETHPERVHIFLRRDDGTETPIPYGALWNQATAVAAGLRQRGLGPGHSVALMLRTEAAFFEAFFGTLLAGAVPVPIYPPFRLDRIEEYVRRQVRILHNAEARLLIAFGEVGRVARLLRGRVPSLDEVTAIEHLSLPEAGMLIRRQRSDDPALVQYTSGSTGDPKGVALSNANILANIQAIGKAIAISPTDIGVTWLPLYHDMGLIGSWLTSLYFGIPIAILSPLAFLARPARWLWAIHSHHATLSAAPNFAFDLCVRKVSEAELEGLDLSSWRLAFNGSEPVSPETIGRFTRRFAPYGFKAETMCPVYGLAECAVSLTVPPLGYPPRVDRVAREAFERIREARPALPEDRTPLRFVSCGRPLAEHEIRIVDGAGHPVAERIEGRIEFRGPSVMSGYFRNPDATRAVLHDEWLDSGDLGYRAEGELFITGREKDLIIKAGRNLYPQEVEEVVGDVPGIRKGCVAAFGITDVEAGTERLVVIAESRETASERVEEIRTEALDRIVTAIGLPPDTLVIARPGTVFKTSSGKIRRSAMRDAYLRGQVERRGRSLGMQWVRLHLQAAGAQLRRFGSRLAALTYGAYIWGLVIAPLPLLWVLLRIVPRGHAANRLVKGYCRPVLALSGCPLRIEGLEHLRGAAPVVLAANHASYVDAGILLRALPVDFRFVAKAALASYPFIGTVIRRVGHLTVERVDPAKRVAVAARTTAILRAGTSLLFFPEGTFFRSPGLLPFRPGAFKAAAEAGCPVIPIGLRGTRELLPDGTWLPKRGPITVSIGAPIPPQGSGWQDVLALRDLVRAEIARLTGEEPILSKRPA
ncbi:acyl-CoA synthetase [Candidatus Methylomirabilis lanthanidiphila]|uniref:Acyl-CoA synthetase n=1 Tax=Candidatus Methylomirabilis lanthanidiphila TaxID=2211376 RepID=A0A564ZJX7_9BACT|nr:AMP-binding protein [Candidatus Methylomirabilis lanthanidiphila]VUZ85625.1 acyl-CoA synthetase [Candidatus Methylomirabilis lanthanidiphila]